MYRLALKFLSPLASNTTPHRRMFQCRGVTRNVLNKNYKNYDRTEDILRDLFEYSNPDEDDS